ncbi:MAG: hypothetical protein NTW32_13490 [Chloroflexi bacterium]|nr:hypothetical protein [Chloroflexota bacterium]
MINIPDSTSKKPVFHMRETPPPANRRLRAFAIDPSLNLNMDDWLVNQVVIRVPWEEKGFGPGPLGEYLDVVDIDPASGLFYQPVNLNDLHLVAQDGLPPDEGNPLFHQQMVYAVAMATINRFERALGRCALWAPHMTDSQENEQSFVRRLRIYPHAMREANAYYSPNKKALLFGYFPAKPVEQTGILPNGIVFTCLSHDVITHETTHALLDGLQRLYVEPSNPDVLAFHEAFSDIVALFQHFTYPEVLRSQISKTHGDLSAESLLSQIALQFGQATGERGALRSAIGKPDSAAYQTQFEPHKRGALLVAAVFDAFLVIYKARIAPILRLATGGTGIIPTGALPVELVDRLADEGAKVAGHVLNICIRALDYLSSMDPTFGEYLRALITADVDMVPDDPHNYRVGFIEAFRRYAIYPRDVRSLSVESLLWNEPDPAVQKILTGIFQKYRLAKTLTPDWVTTSNRQQVYNQCLASRKSLQDFLDKLPNDLQTEEILRNLWLCSGPNAPKTIVQRKPGQPKIDVLSIRPTHRISNSGDSLTDLVISIHQQRYGYFDEEKQAEADKNGPKDDHPDFIVYGGCTLLVDISTSKVRYAIGKRVESERRLKAQRKYLLDRNRGLLSGTYYAQARAAMAPGDDAYEPLALIHAGV